MPNPYFQFKKFTIWHDKCAMKVGTDGVLLGAWAPVEGARRILDIGTGTGLIALMMAQRCAPHTQLVGVEIDADAAEQARENVERSPWKEQIHIVCTDFSRFESEEKFDVITSNPPFFVDSLQAPDQQRNIARHNHSLSYDALLKNGASLLNPNGRFCLVLPTDIAERIVPLAANYDLYPSRRLNIRTKPGGECKRTLLELSFKKGTCEEKELLTEIARHVYSPDYIQLTKDYYLKM